MHSEGERVTIKAGTYVTDFTDGINRGIRPDTDLTGTVVRQVKHMVYVLLDNGKKVYLPWDYAIKSI